MIGAYDERNFEDINAIRRHMNRLEDGTAEIAYHMGFLGLMPPEHFQEGASQTYYEQGYNTRNNQGEKEGKRKENKRKKNAP